MMYQSGTATFTTSASCPACTWCDPDCIWRARVEGATVSEDGTRVTYRVTQREHPSQQPHNRHERRQRIALARRR